MGWSSTMWLTFVWEIGGAEIRFLRDIGKAKEWKDWLGQTWRRGKKNKYPGQGSVFDDYKSKEEFDELLMFILVLLPWDRNTQGGLCENWQDKT